MPTGSPQVDAGLYRQFFETHDPKIREEIILKNLPLVPLVLRAFLGKGIERDTLYSVGCIALIHAVDRFDPTQGVQFSTYAHSIISGEIKHHFRDQTWHVSVPRGLKEDYLQVTKEVERLVQTQGRSPTLAEIAESLKFTRERVIEALEAGKDYQGLSLDLSPRDEGEGEVQGLLSQLTGSDPRSEQFVEGIDLKKAIEKLPAREQLIVSLAHFHEMTQQEIAARLGISQIHVSRLLRQALEKLREELCRTS